MIIPVLPLFVTGTLKASVASLGVIEGVAESTAALLRLASGWLSDRIGRRKPFLIFGYGLSSVAKPALQRPRRQGAAQSAARRPDRRLGRAVPSRPRVRLPPRARHAGCRNRAAG